VERDEHPRTRLLLLLLLAGSTAAVALSAVAAGRAAELEALAALEATLDARLHRMSVAHQRALATKAPPDRMPAEMYETYWELVRIGERIRRLREGAGYWCNSEWLSSGRGPRPRSGPA
jgi:hypothetical protein